MEYGAERKRQLAELHTAEADAGNGTEEACSARSLQCSTAAFMPGMNAGKKKKKSSSLLLRPHLSPAQVQVETPGTGSSCHSDWEEEQS